MMYNEWDGSEDASRLIVEQAVAKQAEAVDLNDYLFIVEERPARGPLRISVLDGSVSGFGRRYLERRWFSIDPLLARAERTPTPFWGWDSLDLDTRGQREFREEAAKSGFRTIAVVPALSPWPAVRGALYFGSTALVQATSAFQAKRPELRALAIDLMTWVVRDSYRRELGPDWKLKQVERAVLRCELLGYTIADTAAMLELPSKTVKYVSRATQIRMRAPTMREAARRAMMAGAIGI